MRRRLVQLVADYGPGELAFAEVAQLLDLVVPDAEIRLAQVPRGDTMAAGWCVARLALCDGPPSRLLVHDIAALGEARFCVGFARDDVTVVGANAGWAWSFVAGEVWGPCYLEVPARTGSHRSPQLLAAAVVRVATRQPHALCESVPQDHIPSLPDAAVAFADCDGNLATTLPQAPAAVGERVRVRIGEVSATALVDDGSAAVGDGELALRAGAPGWPQRDGGRRRFVELFVPGGSAAQRFGAPPGGAPITLVPDARPDAGDGFPPARPGLETTA
jgi:hypothetical protein